MGEQDDYELVAKDDLATLRKELEEVKKDPASKYKSSLTLIEAMDKLANQITRLLDLFEKANKDMYADYQQGVHEESQKLDHVINQNEKLAKGILALADRDPQPKPQAPEPQPESKPQEQPRAEDSRSQEYPLRGPEDMSSAPWKQDSHKSPSRRSLMREFR